jgi:hypothetical protein
MPPSPCTPPKNGRKPGVGLDLTGGRKLDPFRTYLRVKKLEALTGATASLNRTI